MSSIAGTPEPPQEPYQNLDYVYASVQKKSSEQNKLNEAAAYQSQQSPQPTNMNIHDPSSMSDNSGGCNTMVKWTISVKSCLFMCANNAPLDNF